MKIKVEFDIDVDLNKMLKKYLKDGVERYCTSIDIKNVEILKGYFKNGEYIFDEAVFTDIL